LKRTGRRPKRFGPGLAKRMMRMEEPERAPVGALADTDDIGIAAA
jgi:hypothetical protein